MLKISENTATIYLPELFLLFATTNIVEIAKTMNYKMPCRRHPMLMVRS